MRTILFAGKLIQVALTEASFADWSATWCKIPLKRWNPAPVLLASERLSKKLLHDTSRREELLLLLEKQGESRDESELLLADIADFLRSDNLEKKLFRELKDLEPFSLRKLRDASAFEAWVPLGTLVHITPGNAAAVPFLAAVEGLLTGNINAIKLSSIGAEFTLKLLECLASEDPIVIAPRLFAAAISSNEKSLLKSLLQYADGISVWGGEEAVQAIRELSPSSVRFIEWGHKLSFCFISQENIKSNIVPFDELAESICLLDQQACSSPQCIFVECDSWEATNQFAKQLAASLEKISPRISGKLADDASAAEISKVVAVHEAESHLRKAAVYRARDYSWTVLADEESFLRSSPLFRTIFVKPLQRNKIVSSLAPLRSYLQTAGLVCHNHELEELELLLEKTGVQRIRRPSEMLSSYAGEPHDGNFALERFVKRVSVDLPNSTGSITDFAELETHKLISIPGKPIMGKEEFQQSEINRQRADLYFKSGGSSGEPKISTFSYDDYHIQMRHAADGLLAAGLEPEKDLCMNLFFSGGLYGSFLSIFTVLEDMKAKQLPMTAFMDMPFVAQMIFQHKVNVILGMPSFIELLFAANHARFKQHRLIKKIFYGGEHFTLAQRKRYQEEYGVELIRSATYGSVDAGPLGFQCIHCEGSVHHLHSTLQDLEILKVEKDQAVEKGQIGRLVFSSKHREAIKLERYEIGDLGREISGNCACGRKSLRFELMGRYGDIFRVGGNYLNYNVILSILEKQFSYSGELQIKISKPKLDKISLFIEDGIATEEARVVLLESYKELNELVEDEGSLHLDIVSTKKEEFKRNAGSGKLVHIIDERQS